jgi:hypothetical protein
MTFEPPFTKIDKSNAEDAAVPAPQEQQGCPAPDSKTSTTTGGRPAAKPAEMPS